jgi:hypothetical protein
VRLVTVAGPGVPCLIGCLIIILTNVKEYRRKRCSSVDAIESELVT